MADIEDIVEFVSHPSVARATPDIQANQESAGAYIAKQRAYQPFEMGKYYDLAVESKADRKVIGLIGLMREKHQQGAIGWGLTFAHQGKGYATEGATALMRYGFSELGLHRIYAKTSQINAASWRVMERLGMRKEAHFREAERRDGAWIDTVVYAALADEWLSARGYS